MSQKGGGSPHHLALVKWSTQILVHKMPPPLNYRAEQLYVDGSRVKQLFAVSLGAERFWRLGIHDRRGMTALVWSNVVSAIVHGVVRVTGSGSRRRWRKLAPVEIALPPVDSAMALNVARQAVTLIEDHDCHVLDALVRQQDAAGKLAGVHDVVCEKRGGSGLASF